MEITTYDYVSPLGVIRYQIKEGKLIGMSFNDTQKKYPNYPEMDKHLNAYFSKRTPLKFPVHFDHGTTFQLQVWNALLTIPLGETRTYQQMAQLINNPKAIRAVGQACKANPIGLVVPCHRVIGKSGEMTGYSGPKYVGLKKSLLIHEGVFKE